MVTHSLQIPGSHCIYTPYIYSTPHSPPSLSLSLYQFKIIYFWLLYIACVDVIRFFALYALIVDWRENCISVPIYVQICVVTVSTSQDSVSCSLLPCFTFFLSLSSSSTENKNFKKNRMEKVVFVRIFNFWIWILKLYWIVIVRRWGEITGGSSWWISSWVW